MDDQLLLNAVKQAYDAQRHRNKETRQAIILDPAWDELSPDQRGRVMTCAKTLLAGRACGVPREVGVVGDDTDVFINTLRAIVQRELALQQLREAVIKGDGVSPAAAGLVAKVMVAMNDAVERKTKGDQERVILRFGTGFGGNCGPTAGDGIRFIFRPERAYSIRGVYGAGGGGRGGVNEFDAATGGTVGEAPRAQAAVGGEAAEPDGEDPNAVAFREIVKTAYEAAMVAATNGRVTGDWDGLLPATKSELIELAETLLRPQAWPSFLNGGWGDANLVAEFRKALLSLTKTKAETAPTMDAVKEELGTPQREHRVSPYGSGDHEEILRRVDQVLAQLHMSVLDELDIGGAVAAMKAGLRVARQQQKAVNSFLFYVRNDQWGLGDDVPVDTGALDHSFRPWLAIRHADGSTTPWRPTDEDLLAKDYVILI